LRGAPGWTAGCDAILSVLADIEEITGTAKNRQLALAKARDGEAGPVAPFDLEFVELGRDSDGDAFGSVYVVPRLDRVPSIMTPAPFREPESLMIFRQAFVDVAISSSFPYRVRGTGPEVKAVRLLDVKAEFAKRYATGEADEDSRKDVRSAFNRARKVAREKGAFGFEADGDGTELVWALDNRTVVLTGKAPPIADTPAPDAVSGMPFVMTHDMKARLADLGYTVEQISDMTPGQAHEILAGGRTAG
jgi:hypothetical protein